MSKSLFSLRVDDQNPRHTRLTVFNRGANAGTLTILTDDLDEFQKRLSGATFIRQNVGTIGPGAKVTGVKIDRLSGEWLRTSGTDLEYGIGDEDSNS